MSPLNTNTMGVPKWSVMKKPLGSFRSLISLGGDLESHLRRPGGLTALWVRVSSRSLWMAQALNLNLLDLSIIRSEEWVRWCEKNEEGENLTSCEHSK